MRAVSPSTIARSAFVQALLDRELEPVAELLELDGLPRPAAIAKAAELLPGYAALAGALTQRAIGGGVR